MLKVSCHLATTPFGIDRDVNKDIEYITSDGHEIIDIQFSCSDNAMHVLIIYKKVK